VKPVGRTFKLFANELTNIPRRKELDDFAFIVGDCRYSPPTFVANFSSPKIAHRHDVEATVCEYGVETKDR
jgi:hypothetical protein